jgi:hypothetical protein
MSIAMPYMAIKNIVSGSIAIAMIEIIMRENK